jgi:hypothetical protein
MTKKPKPSKPRPGDVIEVNPTVTAPFKWNVLRPAPNSTLAVNANRLAVTEGGALTFF